MSHLVEVLFVYVLFHHLFSHLKWYRSLEATLIQKNSGYTLHPTVATQAFVLHQHFKCTWKKATITELDLLWFCSRDSKCIVRLSQFINVIKCKSPRILTWLAINQIQLKKGFYTEYTESFSVTIIMLKAKIRNFFLCLF